MLVRMTFGVRFLFQFRKIFNYIFVCAYARWAGKSNATALVQQRKIEFAFEEDKYAWNVSRAIITASFRLYFIKFYSAISTIRTLCVGRYALISCK